MISSNRLSGGVSSGSRQFQLSTCCSGGNLGRDFLARQIAPKASPPISPTTVLALSRVGAIGDQLQPRGPIGLLAEQKHLAHDVRNLVARDVLAAGRRSPIEQPIGALGRRFVGAAHPGQIDRHLQSARVGGQPGLQRFDVVHVVVDRQHVDLVERVGIERLGQGLGLDGVVERNPLGRVFAPGIDRPRVSASQVRSMAMLCQIVGQSPTLEANSVSLSAASRQAPRRAGSIAALKLSFHSASSGAGNSGMSCLANSGTDGELLIRISNCKRPLILGAAHADLQHQVRPGGDQLIVGHQRLRDQADGVVDRRRDLLVAFFERILQRRRCRPESPPSCASSVAFSARATGLSGYF